MSSIDLNSRLGFIPKKTATYRAVVTSVQGGISGKYMLQVGTLKKIGEPTMVEGKLTEESRKTSSGQYVATHKIGGKISEFRLIDLLSMDFDPRLNVVHNKKVIGYGFNGEDGLNSRFVLGAEASGDYFLNVSRSSRRCERGLYAEFPEGHANARPGVNRARTLAARSG